MSGVTQTVVASMYGERFCRIREGQRPKHAKCGGFFKCNLFTLPKGEALEQGFSPCNNCYNETDTKQNNEVL